ncbi:MAG: hypothetical protein JJT76_08280 [Clostridiaceae bacterium]|nr:hypothetical protein [Clostridiaceae bacterium]
MKFKWLFGFTEFNTIHIVLSSFKLNLIYEDMLKSQEDIKVSIDREVENYKREIKAYNKEEVKEMM